MGARMTDKLASEILKNIYKGSSLSDIMSKTGASQKDILSVIEKTKINIDGLLPKQEQNPVNNAVTAWDSQVANLKLEAVNKLMERGYSQDIAANLVEKGYENVIIDENTNSDMIMNAALLKARKNDLISVKPGIAVMNQAASQLIDAHKNKKIVENKKDDGIYKI
jgi:hypothetical protein